PPSDLIHSLARSERFLWIFTDLSRRSRVTIYRLSCAYFRGVPRPPFRHGTHAPAAADLGRAGTRTPPMTTPLRGRAGRRRSEIVRSCGGSVYSRAASLADRSFSRATVAASPGQRWPVAGSPPPCGTRWSRGTVAPRNRPG